MVIVVRGRERVEDGVEGALGLGDREVGVRTKEEGGKEGEQVVHEVEREDERGRRVTHDVLERYDEKFEGFGSLA
jgi:hypothetical protein